MPLGIPWRERGDPVYHLQLDTTANPTTAFTATATLTHTKGNWMELVTATEFDVGMVGMVLRDLLFASTVDTGVLIDLGTGGAGSETVIVANIAMGGNDTKFGKVMLPIFIPKGSRIAFRCQSVVSADTVGIWPLRLWPHTSHFQPGTQCETVGADTSTTQGVTVAAGNGQWGSWVQLSAAIDKHARWAVLSLGILDSTCTGGTMYFQLGFGAAASEVIAVPMMGQVETSSSEILWITVWAPWPVNIPKGARVAIRAWGSAGIDDVSAVVHLFS